MSRTTSHLVALLLTAVLGACSAGEGEASPKGVNSRRPSFGIFVVNYPLQYFAERIAGAAVAVHFPAPREGDPAYWMPEPETIVAYQGAELILLNGAGYARWLQKVSLPLSKLVDTSKAVADRYIALDAVATHSHGPEGAHTHGGFAFTTWLDPEMAIAQAAAIEHALAEIRPEHAAEFAANRENLAADLRHLDREMRELTQGHADRPLLASHPVYQYWQRRYGLNLVSVHWEPDAAPPAEAWSDLAEILSRHPAKWMIWEGEPLPDTVRRLQELGVRSAVFEPCGNVPETGDYLSVMQQNLDRLKPVFGG
jgi:zinc transport system substrate-binding protein